MTQITTPGRFIGCDVGKRQIVTFDSHSGKTRTLDNSPRALSAFARQLTADCLVVCEATGGHEAALLAALTKAGIPAHRADARKVKAFIRSFGTLAKTDAIDARALARYGRERHHSLSRWRTPDKIRVKLQALVLTRRDLVDNRTAWKNRAQAPETAAVAASLRAVIACLDQQIAVLDAKIETLLNRCHELTRSRRVLAAIPGIGNTTAATLLALMPELGTLSRRQAASLAGLAPHPRQSGTSNAYRRTRGGRTEVKRTLFMAALVAARHNPNINKFYTNLRTNGKKPIVAITAVMRKLIVIANAKIRDEALSNQVS